MSTLKTFWPVVFVVISACRSSASEYSDECISVDNKIGTCVPLTECPLFSSWLKQRPLSKDNLRLLVRYTCYFDISNPKVCCPNKSLNPSQEEPVDPFSFRLGDRAIFPSKTENEHLPLTFPSTGKWNAKFSESDGKQAPLYFPTEESLKFKEPKDLTQHPNFHLIPKLQECSNAVKLDSLVGTYGTHPWLALVGVKKRNTFDFEHVCSGAVINDRYVVTAAHCFLHTKPKYVRLGEYDLTTLIDQGSEFLPQSRREDYKIEQITPHPNYNPYSFGDDIALIRVAKPILLNTTFIKAICLPFVKEYEIEGRLDVNNLSGIDRKTGWVAGWSHYSWDGLYSRGSQSSVLEEGFVDFTSHDRCRQDFPSVTLLNARNQFCVGGKGKRNSCVVDSGGPLIYPVKVPSPVPKFVQPKFFLLGLLSHGPAGGACSGGGGSALPTSVYTRISKYLLWILDNIKE